MFFSLHASNNSVAPISVHSPVKQNTETWRQAREKTWKEVTVNLEITKSKIFNWLALFSELLTVGRQRAWKDMILDDLSHEESWFADVLGK